MLKNNPHSWTALAKRFAEFIYSSTGILWECGEYVQLTERVSYTVFQFVLFTLYSNFGRDGRNGMLWSYDASWAVLYTFKKFYARAELKSDNIYWRYEMTCFTERIRWLSRIVVCIFHFITGSAQCINCGLAQVCVDLPSYCPASSPKFMCMKYWWIVQICSYCAVLLWCSWAVAVTEI